VIADIEHQEFSAVQSDPVYVNFLIGRWYVRCVRSSYLVFFLLVSSALAQLTKDSLPSVPTSSVPPPLRWHEFVTNIPGDWLRYSKTAFGSEGIPEWIGIVALTAGFYATDGGTYRTSKQWHASSGTVEYWGNLFKEMGDGRSQFGLAGAFALYGFVARNDRALRTGSQITEVVLASGAVVQVLKHLTGRRSPDGDPEYATIWRPFPNQIEYHKHVSSYDAFPSGHITTSMATVVVLAENYPEIKWIRPVGYTLVALVSVGMVNTGIHWYSDYPLGIALGYAFGMIVSHPEGAPLTGASDNMTIAPVAVGDGYGIGLSIKLR
jgi:membrane-associated phospholipid phosphatase